MLIFFFISTLHVGHCDVPQITYQSAASIDIPEATWLPLLFDLIVDKQAVVFSSLLSGSAKSSTMYLCCN